MEDLSNYFKIKKKDGGNKLEKEMKAGWLKASFEIFGAGAIILLVAYFTLNNNWILIPFIFCVLISIISIIWVINLMKRHKINWKDVKIFVNRKS